MIVYDGPDILLALTSGAGAIGLIALVYQSVRVKPRKPLQMFPNVPEGARSVV